MNIKKIDWIIVMSVAIILVGACIVVYNLDKKWNGKVDRGDIYYSVEEESNVYEVELKGKYSVKGEEDIYKVKVLGLATDISEFWKISDDCVEDISKSDYNKYIGDGNNECYKG